MKTLLASAAALTVAASAVAAGSLDDYLAANTASNPVTNIEQLEASAGVSGYDAATVILLNAAAQDDDALTVRALTAGSEVVSTQSFDGEVNGQFTHVLGDDAAGMTLSEAVSAYMDEVAD